jgi:hypothetical protein
MLIETKTEVVMPNKNRKEDNDRLLLIKVRTATMPIISS